MCWQTTWYVSLVRLSARDNPDYAPFLQLTYLFASLQSNAQQAVFLRQQRQVPLSDFGSLAAAGRGVSPVHLHNSMLGVIKTILAEEMPLVEPLPPYKAWDYLVRNELAQGVGRQMYYTDEIGRTWRAHLKCHRILKQLCIHSILSLQMHWRMVAHMQL